MALRQYAAKVATPHLLRGSSPLGEPMHFSETVSRCRGIGGGQPPYRCLELCGIALNSKKISEHHCIFA